MPNINIPGVGIVAFPDDMSQDQIGVAIRQDILPGIQKSGFGAAFGAGIQGLKSAYYGGKYGLTGDEADRAALLESQAKEAEKYQGPSYEDVKEAFKERGVMAGLGRTWEAAKGAAGQSLPYMAAPVAAAALAPEAAIAGVGLGTLGFLGTSAAQYTGQNVGRQVQEQQAAIERGETPQELSLGRAAAASVPAALLDRFALGQTFKGTGLGKLFGQEGKEGIEAVARQVIEKGTNPSKLKSILTGGARGIGAEIPNEVGQQILERAQAGLDLTNDDAIREYKEAAFGATLLGGPFGGAGGMGMRNAGIKTAADWETRAAEETQKFNQKEADRLKAMETTKTSVLDGIRAANEREAQRLGWQGDIQQVGAEALDRSLTLMDSPEGVDTILGDMKTHFPGTPVSEIKKLQVQLRTYKQRMVAQQKEDAKKAKESAFTEAAPDLLGEIRPEAPAIGEAIARPEFQLEAPQPSPQMELNLGQPEPLATPKQAAPITDQYLRGFGLDKRNDAYKALIGLDLNKPADVAQAKTVINDVLEGKASNVQGKVDKMIRTDPRFQEQATFFDEIDKQQADLDAAEAEAARGKRNEGLAQLLAQLETENAAKEEADRLAREQADKQRAADQRAADQRATLAKGVTEDITQIPFTGQLAPAQAPEIQEAAPASASVPSEAGVESAAGRPEPSMVVYDESGGQGAEAGVEPSGEPLGLAERDVEGAVEATGDLGGTLTPEPEVAITPEVAPEVAPEVTTTDEQRALAQKHADQVGGEVVWQQGDLGLVRGYSPLSGQPNYAVVKGGNRSRVDVDAYTGNMITPEEKAQLSEAKKQIEEADKTREQFDPFAGKDIAVSQSIPAGVANVLAGWKKLLGINARVYVTTTADARANQSEFTGDYRAIASAGLEASGGTMRRLPNGDYYISFVEAPSRAKILETLAHELGHVHEREVFENAPAETKAAIRAEFEKWLGANKTGTAKDLVEALRARKTGKATQVAEGMQAKELTGYWKSFGEWYADQVSRWATTSEKPVSVVEKFFQRLGRALKAFYQKVHNAKYLPNETFKQYLDKVADSVTFEEEVSTPETRGAAVNRARAELRKQGLTKDEIDEQLAAMTPEEIESDFPAGRTEPLTKEQMRAIEKQARIDGDTEHMLTSAVTAEELFNLAGGFNPTPASTRALNSVKSTIDSFSTMEKVVNKINDLRTRTFSADTKYNARVRNALQQAGLDWKELMLTASSSQALHRGGLAERFLEWGTLTYDKAMNRWDSKRDDTNIVSMGQQIRKIADEMGADPIAVKGWVGEAWVAKRLQNIGNEIAALEKEIDGFGPAKTAAAREYQANRKEKLELLQRVAELRTPEQLAAGLQLYDKLGADNMRALNDMKNTMRKRVLNMLVDTEVMSKEKAETFLENAEWVPFYRVTEEDNSIGGPAVLSKGLSEQMKEKKLKGATGVDDTKQVSGVDNLVKWLDWSVRRAVSNQQKRVMVDMFKEHVSDEIHEGKGNKGYTISVMEDGREKFYHFDDPLIAEAFTGMLPVMVPGMKAWRSATEGLRKAITRFPLFPAAQVVQDTYDAMFTSGLKHPAKLITEVLREMYRTYKGESGARETLMGRGILSRDYSAAAEQEAAEVLAGLKDQNWWQKVNMNLERFSSTADHVVRQAVYNRAKAEGLSEREATEKATEIINFRRQGSATWVNWMRTMVPFFGAYLQVQNVALKTLSGEGISPTERKSALASLAMTAAKVGLFSMVYSMIMGDDDDYKKMDRRTRDRMILIPGTDVGIAIRPNVFATPKIFAEHAYGYITDNGTTDGAKIRAAAKAALVDSVLPSSYAVPQLVRPALEVAMDHNIFLDRPIVGNLKNLEKAEQFTSSTSELAKLLGASALSPWSPVQWDHLIRGYTSSVGSVLTLATNDAIAAASGKPRPDRSWQDTINSIPNMGNFITKEFGTGDKTDFYELAGDVEKVNSTVNRLTKQGRIEDVKEYLGDEENKRLYALKSQVSAIQNNLAKVRAQKNLIIQAPESRMNAAQKEVEIRKLNEAEQRMLANVGKLRKMAGY